MAALRLEQQALLVQNGHSESSDHMQDSYALQPLRPQSTASDRSDNNHECDPASLLTEDLSTHQVIEHENHWHPIWLHKPVLGLITALFAGLASSLVMIWKLEQAQNGFRLTITTDHLAWTYGPTAILILVLSAWRQVDYHCRLLQPWMELCKGPTDAARSVLLDYVSPITINSFVGAIKRRHYVVAASIVGFALMKLIILLSTGLLVLQPTTLEDSFQITVTSEFNSSPLWQSVVAGEMYTMYGGRLQQGPPYNNVSSHPVTANLGYLEKMSNGGASTLETMAFQTYQLNADSEAQNVWAEVDVFTPNISCISAETIFNSTYLSTYPHFDLKSDTCSFEVKDTSSSSRYSYATWLNGCRRDCPQLLFGAWRFLCANGPLPHIDGGLNSSSSYDIRYAFLVANMSFESVALEHLYEERAVAVAPYETAAIICKTDYFVNKARVDYHVASSSFSVGETTEGTALSNFTNNMLGELVWTALASTEGIDVEGGSWYNRYKSDSDVNGPLFYTMLRTLKGNQKIETLLSETNLHDATIKALAGIATQFMKENYVVAASHTHLALGTYVEDRLHIGLLPLWGMVTGFLVMILLASWIMLSMLPGVAPHNPSMIATSAAALSKSPSLQQRLRHAGSMRTSQLRVLLQGFVFRATSHGIQLCEKDGAGDHAKCWRPKAKAGTWIPVAAGYPMLCLTFAAPIVAIVSLQVLFQVSLNHHGIVDVTGHEILAQRLATILSALLVLMIATCLNALDFNIAVFAPYSLLRSGEVPVCRGLCFNLLGLLPPLALIRSLKNHHFSSALSNVTGMISSVLTIVVSGLWLVDRNMISEQVATAAYIDKFDIQWYNSSSSGDAGAALLMDKIQHGGSTMPASIWDGFVLPVVADVHGPDHRVDLFSSSPSRNFTFTVDALRPELSCDIVDDQDITIEYSYYDVMVTAKPPLPRNCQRGGPNGTNKYMTYSVSLTNLQDRWTGNMYDVHLGPYPENPKSDKTGTEVTKEYGEEDRNLRDQNDNPAGCPSIGILFGKGKNDSTTKDDVTALLCSQKVQQVRLDVTYHGLDWMKPTINTAIAPVVDQSSGSYLTNGTKDIDTFPYRVQTYLSFPNLTRVVTNWGANDIDLFINHVVYGPNGTSLEDMYGRANRNNLVTAVQLLYNRYMTLVVDMRFRQPLPPDDQRRVVNGVIKATTSRLKIDRTSKSILQALLGCMTLLGFAAFLLADLRGSLPRNPCSIASTMAFLAGSNLCDEKGSLAKLEHLSSAELEATFEGLVFSLGWWDEAKEDGTEEASEANMEDSSSSQRECGERRFGIDIGVPAQLGFRETKAYALRKRFTKQ